ncbi:uncharacterized protein LOC122371835 [Amphibalanus amphitrite]|uniref:uncharacterized protein LOC122371835 n=1 Tax=Amphibalanus amphitrite TaxID=1232801 RepID=UPI001C903446|nr:uncharacterized protein LOC122371835 [Amphibalanus amphitrite]
MKDQKSAPESGVKPASAADAAADLRLIPEFDGATQPVTEWLEKVELVCRLRGIEALHVVVPLRLTGGAFAVYQQLDEQDKAGYETIKKGLISAFAEDKFDAYDRFEKMKLRRGEPVDVFVAELRRLSSLFGGMSDSGLACAFVAKLPETTRRVLRAGSRVESMTLSELISRARAVLADEEETAMAAATGAAATGAAARTSAAPPLVTCHSCGQPNHLSRDCLAARGQRERGGARGGRRSVHCFRCNRPGHIASSCPENDGGEEGSAPASSPGLQ